MRHLLLTLTPLGIGLLCSHSSAAQEPVSKDVWLATIRGDARIETTICAADGFVVSCTTPFLSPETKAEAKLDASSCTEAAKEILDAALSNGNPVGAAYHQLPAFIGTGYQMDQYASMLGEMVGTTLVQAVVANGGSVVQDAACQAKAAAGFKVTGN